MGFRLASRARLDRLGAEHEAPVTIAALDKSLVAHLKIDFGVAKRALPAVAGNARAVHDNDFGRFDGHVGFSGDLEIVRII
jgi:hypothetical protein